LKDHILISLGGIDLNEMKHIANIASEKTLVMLVLTFNAINGGSHGTVSWIYKVMMTKRVQWSRYKVGNLRREDGSLETLLAFDIDVGFT